MSTKKLRRIIDARDVIETQIVTQISTYEKLQVQDKQDLATKVKAVLVTQFDALVDYFSEE